MRIAVGIVATGLLLLLGSSPARGDEPPVDPAAPTPAQIDLTKDTKSTDLTAPPPEAPPAAPYKKSLVLDSTIGAMGFLGAFHKVSPWGPWLHTQLGYELLRWLMVFGEGELAFTDTSNKVNPPMTRAFPIFGFGGGARFTIPIGDRFGVYGQGSLGAMKADVGQNVLGLFGFRDAESLGLYLGARVGVEWYQVDRHFALGLNTGVRTPQGFTRNGSGGTPAAIDTGVALRYAF